MKAATNTPQSLALDRAGAAKFTGLSVTSIDREILRGRLKAKKYGKRVLILRSEAQRFLEALPDQPPPNATPKAS